MFYFLALIVGFAIGYLVGRPSKDEIQAQPPTVRYVPHPTRDIKIEISEIYWNSQTEENCFTVKVLEDGNELLEETKSFSENEIDGKT